MVYIRSTLGFSYVDPTHERNADGARAAGLEFGFYHFCTASTTDEAVRQARFFRPDHRPLRLRAQAGAGAFARARP